MITIEIQDFNETQTQIYNEIINTPASKIKYHLIRAGRQSGKTFLLKRLAGVFASKPGSKIAYMNAEHDNNTFAFNEINELFNPVISKAINSTGGRLIEFKNKSEIHFYSAKNHKGRRGPSWDFLIGDEFGYWPPTSWEYSIRPTILAKPNAKVVLSSTPCGKNHFWSMHQEAQIPGGFTKEYYFNYTSNDKFDQREIENAKLNQFSFRQEYLAEFVFGKGQVFGEFTKLQKINNDKWNVVVPRENYYFGLDIAGPGNDSTILTIINSKGEVVFIFEPESTLIPHQANELEFQIRRWNNVSGLGECNGLGLGLVELLQTKGLNITKFWTSNESKQKLVTEILQGIANEQLSLPNIDIYPKLDNEMSTYEGSRTLNGKYTYGHPQGLHDDTVDSLMLAWHALNYKGSIEFYDDNPKIQESPFLRRDFDPIDDYINDII